MGFWMGAANKLKDDDVAQSGQQTLEPSPQRDALREVSLVSVYGVESDHGTDTAGNDDDNDANPKLSPRGKFFKTLSLLVFIGTLCGFVAGAGVTLLVLDGKLDIDKESIKKMIRTVTGR